MDLQISCTEDGIKTYPLHNHKKHEIIYYLKGEGYLRTRDKNLPFSPGTIIIVPPNIDHGSVSKKEFKNICVSGEFEHLLNFTLPVVLFDNEKREGKKLAELIYENRLLNNDYLLSLCISYIHFLCQSVKIDNSINASLKKIISEISANAFDSDFDLKPLLLKSGYSEDYIRHCFKKNIGKTPTEFLSETRIKHSCHLIEIYKDTLSMGQIAEQCGFLDYVYFSKCFKKITGISPAAYRKQIL